MDGMDNVGPAGQSFFRLPRSGGGGGDPRSSSEESLLETPTYSIVLVLLAFQAVSILFTVVVKSIQHVLRSRRRLGLLEAVNHSVHELTLLGFVSIILLTLEQPISDICVDVAYFRADWTVLQFVYGEGYCPCCLESTSNVQKCVLEYASCGDLSGEGDEFCNCDAADPTCVYPKKDTAVPLEEQACDGPVALDGQDRCGEGKVRAVSILALEQVHYMIFLLSIVHVLCGFVLYGLAWLRVKWEWGRWEKQHDVHHEKVSEVLNVYYNDLEESLQRQSMGRPVGHGRSKSEGEGFKEKDPSLMSCPSRIGEVDLDEDADEEADGSGAGRAGEDGTASSQRQERTTRRVTVAFVDDGGIDHDAMIEQRPNLERRSATLPKVLGQEDGPQPGLGLRRSLRRARSFHNLAVMERKFRLSVLSHMNQWSRGAWRLTKDKSHSLLQGAGPLLVSQSQYYKLRASFVYTHKLGGTFNFLSHVMASMEEDLAHLVGITPLFWIITMIFWLISGVIGYAIMPFFAVTAIFMVVLNAKLADIVKGIVSKVGTGHALILDESIFWFRRPSLMLQPMKFCLFFTSAVYSSFIFFAWQFGSHSCAFTDSFYGKSWVLPWWSIIIFNTVIFLHLACVTFPAYSLAVQMGSNLKGHMMPSRFVKKLLKAVDDAKREVEEEERLKRERQGDAVDGRMATINKLFRRSAGAIVPNVPKQRESPES